MEKVHPRPSSAKFSTTRSISGKRFTRIYARDRPFVRRVLLRFGVPARDVEDVVQEVFVLMWQRLGELVVDVDLRPWLYVVAANHANNYRRLNRCTKEYFVADAPDLAAVEFDPGWMMDAHRRFARFLRRLSRKLREVFVRVAVTGQSIKEAAEELRIPNKTAQARMKLARDVVLRLKAA